MLSASKKNYIRTSNIYTGCPRGKCLSANNGGTIEDSHVKCVMNCDTHVMTVGNIATSCCQGGCQPRRPASERQAVYLDLCYDKYLMCSAANVYNYIFYSTDVLSYDMPTEVDKGKC